MAWVCCGFPPHLCCWSYLGLLAALLLSGLLVHTVTCEGHEPEGRPRLQERYNDAILRRSGHSRQSHFLPRAGSVLLYSSDPQQVELDRTRHPRGETDFQHSGSFQEPGEGGEGAQQRRHRMKQQAAGKALWGVRPRRVIWGQRPISRSESEALKSFQAAARASLTRAPSLVATSETLETDAALLSLLVHHCSAIYTEDSASLAAWTCSRCGASPVASFHLVSLIKDPDALLQAYVGVHHDKSLVVVCFRGTHSTYMKNWIDDLYALELDLDYPGVEHAMVHRGFYHAYHHTELRPQVTAHVKALLAAHPNYSLAITGHSLGAALASLSALDLVVGFEVPSEKVRVVTFGSPRVGNFVFSGFFNKTLPRSMRVTHGHDLVVHLPPQSEHGSLLGYHHVPQEIWYHRFLPFSKAESYRECDGTGEDIQCSRSVPGSSIMDHLVYLGVPLCNVPTVNALEALGLDKPTSEILRLAAS